MKWDTLDADVNKIMNKHFTKGRDGRKIDKIVIHYNAGDLTTEGCWQVWQTRQASAHYQVESSGRIGQLVWDSDTAWHAGNWDANQSSIGVEHANQGNNFTEACIDSGAHLVAALCKHFGLGAPAWMVNVFPHNYFSATACPSRLAGGLNSKYMSKALDYYRQMTGTVALPAAPKTVSKPTSVDIEGMARDVIAGKYGNGDARKRALGSNYAAVQARVNELMRGTSQKKTVDQVAREVIAGKYGNGEARRDALSAAGYSYQAVQDRVNQILLG